jgi:diguanylate cyclase (GGDEF)-like protein
VLVALFAAFLTGSVLRRGHPGQVLILDVGVFDGVTLIAAGLCATRPADRRGVTWAWRLVAAALGCTIVGDLAFSALATDRTPPPMTSAADAFYLAAYPLCYTAVVLVVRTRVGRFLSSVWLDGLVTGLGVAAAVSWGSALYSSASNGPVLTVAGGQGPGIRGVVTALAYPVGDAVLLVLLVASAAVLGARPDRELALTVGGLAFMSCADTIYVVQSNDRTYTEGGLADVLQLLGVVMIGLAATLPSRSTSPDRAPGRDASVDGQLSWRILVLPAVASVASVLMLALDGRGRPSELARLLAAACVLAALTRVFLSFREIRDLSDVHRQARTDDLTGLPNRRAFYEACDALLHDDPATPVALALLDLDRFKEINDSLGHAAGDELLIQVGRRLRSALRDGDLLARLGGDEFAVLMPTTTEDDALGVSAELRRLLRTSFVLDSLALHVDGSIGVASSPVAGSTRSELLRCADVAMYQAKTSRSGAMSYAAVDSAHAVQQLRTVEELRRSLDDDPEAGRLVVHLQPQIQMGGGQVVGVEALLRWDHPRRGVLPPAAFLGTAETAGLMSAITETVLSLSLAACRTWWQRGHRIPVSVNVSAADIHDLTLPIKVIEALQHHRLPAQALLVELTEDTLMTDPQRARGVLERLRALGVGVAIDDYGTGYSSLAYLRHLPVDQLKIDRVFIAGLVDDPASAAIVRHTVDLAHALGLRGVAEGVEDHVALLVITGLGGDIAQGHHIAPPMPTEAFGAWLDARAAGHPDGRRPPAATLGNGRASSGAGTHTAVSPLHG